MATTRDNVEEMFEAVESGNFDKVKQLRPTHGLYGLNKKGATLLHAAAKSGNVDLFHYLTDEGLDPNAVDRNGETVFHMACFSGKRELVSYISKRYSDLKKTLDKKGFSALHYCSAGGSIETFDFLYSSLALDASHLSKDGKNVLHVACQYGRIQMVKYLDNKFPSMRYKTDNYGETVLHFAAYSGNVLVFQHFESTKDLDMSPSKEQELSPTKELDVYSKNKAGRTVLHKACSNRKHSMVKYLVKTYPDLKKVQDNNKDTVLHACVAGGSVELFRFLAEEGVSVNKTSKNGGTVLHKACWFGNLEMVKHLCITYPYLCDKKDKKNRTPLQLATERQFEMLDKKDKKNRTPLQLATERQFEMLVNYLSGNPNESKEYEAVESSKLFKLCQQGDLARLKEIDLSLYPHPPKEKDGSTLLHAASQSGNIDLFVYLTTDLGLDPNSQDDGMKTVVHTACYSGKDEMVYFLLERYPELIEIRDSKQWTLLHFAAASGNIELFGFLVDKGLNVFDVGVNKESVLHIACQIGSQNMVEYIAKTVPKLMDLADDKQCTPLHYCAVRGDVETFKFIIKQEGQDYFRKASRGKTVLHLACLNGRLNMVKYLIQHFPELKHQSDKDELTALHHVSICGNVDIFQLLVQEGLRVKKLNRRRENVLHIACRYGNYELVNYLATKYPDLGKETDERGISALMRTAYNNHAEVLSCLIDRGLFKVENRGIRNLINVLLKRNVQSKHHESKKLLEEEKLSKAVSDTEVEKGPEDAIEAASTFGSGIFTTPASVLESVSESRSLSRSSSPAPSLGTPPGTPDFSEGEPEWSSPDLDWSMQIGFLSPSLIRDHIRSLSHTSKEVNMLLQWICCRAESTLEKVDVAQVWAGYEIENETEPVLVAVCNEETNKVQSEFDSFKLIMRKDGNVSSEGEEVFNKEVEEGLSFSEEDARALRECLEKETVKLMKEHSNLQIVSPSHFKSKRHGHPDASVNRGICIVLYVPVKGVIPFHEKPFPPSIGGYPTDVREGYFFTQANTLEYHSKLKMGCQIMSEYGLEGSLGGFVKLLNGHICCLTCWHVFLSEDSRADLTADGYASPSFFTSLNHPCTHFKADVFQPSKDFQPEDETYCKFGKVIEGCIDPRAEGSIGVDAALVEITKPERYPESGDFPRADRPDAGVDAALVEITKPERYPESGDFPRADKPDAGYNKDTPMVFDTGKIIKDFKEVDKDTIVEKYGFKTGQTRGVVRVSGPAVCKRKVVYYVKSDESVNYELHQQIEISRISVKQDEPFSDFGDSGSLVFQRDGNKVLRALGMIVGSTTYKSTIVTPIWAILKKFNLPLTLLPFNTDPNEERPGADNKEERIDNLEKGVSSLKIQVVEMEKDIKEETKAIKDNVSSLQKDMKVVTDDMKSLRTGMDDLRSDTGSTNKEIRLEVSEVKQSQGDILSKVDTTLTKVDTTMQFLQEFRQEVQENRSAGTGSSKKQAGNDSQNTYRCSIV